MKYWLDGVNLNDPQGRWFPDRETGVRIAPARRKGGIEYPKVDGVQFIKNQPFDPSIIKVSLDIWGQEHEDFMLNLEFMYGLMNQRHKLMEFIHRYDLANTAKDRVAQVECLAIDEPSLYSRKNARIEAIFQVPSVFWRSKAEVTTTAIPITAAPLTSTLTALDGGSGAIDDSLIQIKGAFSGATIVDTNSGLSFRVTGALTTAQYLVIDPKNWKARLHSTNSWSLTTGTVWDTKVVPLHGYGSMFTLHPGVDVATTSMRYRVTVSGTNVAGSPTVTFRAKNAYQ